MFKILKNLLLATFCIFILLLILIAIADFKSDDFSKKQTTKLQNFRFLQSTTLNKSTQSPVLKKVQCNFTPVRGCPNINNYANWEYKYLENWIVEDTNAIMETSNKKRKIRQVLNVESEFAREDPTAKTLSNGSEKLPSTIICQEYKKNCTISCWNGHASSIPNDPNICHNTALSLMVEKCVFSSGTLEKRFFNMQFPLSFLFINECNLTTIKAGAFKHENVKNLHTLILTNNQLFFLKDSTFEGLPNLLHFKLVQSDFCCTFQGKGFLYPVQNTIKKATLQLRTNSSDVVDPLNWWLDLHMNCLTDLDISNTNLNGTLNSNTFKPFVSLESLRLLNCNLFSIESEVFAFISRCFQYLDLRFNHLQTLDNKFLHWLGTTFIKIELSYNKWNCSCGAEMMRYFEEQEVLSSEEIICYSPERYQQTKMMEVLQSCKKNEFITNTTSIINSREISNVVTSTKTVNEISTIPTTAETTTTRKSSGLDATLDKTSSTTTKVPVLSKTPNFTSVNCFVDEKRMKAFSKNIVNANPNFSLHINSSTSITIKVRECKMFSVYYFPKYHKCEYIYYPECKNRKNKLESEAVIYIQDLIPSTAYLLCLVIEEDLLISPFDCRSVFMEINEVKTAWLLQSEKVWFITINTMAAILLFFLSAYVVYRILRYNSHRLEEHKIKSAKFRNKSRKISLSHKKSSYISEGFPNASPLCATTSSTYLFCKPLHQNSSDNDSGNTIYTSEHRVPTSKAPILPPSTVLLKTNNNSESAVEKYLSNNGDYLNITDFDPDNKTSENYEILNVQKTSF